MNRGHFSGSDPQKHYRGGRGVNSGSSRNQQLARASDHVHGNPGNKAPPPAPISPRKRKRSPVGADKVAKQPRVGQAFDTFEDELDLLGSAALEDYELTQRERSGSPSCIPIPGNQIPIPSTNPIPKPISSKAPISNSRTQFREGLAKSVKADPVKGAKFSHPNTFPQSRTDVVGSSQLQGPACDKNGRGLDKKIQLLQEQNYTKDGEVKVLRGEKDRLLAELRKKEEQMKQMQAALLAEKEAKERQLTRERDTLKTKLQFKEQEVIKLQEHLERKAKPSGAGAVGRSLSPGRGAVSQSQPQKTSPKPSRGANSGRSQASSSDRQQQGSAGAFLPSSVSGRRGVATPLTAGRTRRGSESLVNTRSRSISPNPSDLKKMKRKSLSDKGPESVSRSPSVISSISQASGSAAGDSGRDIDAPSHLTVPGRELDGSQILLLLIDRKVLKHPQHAAQQVDQQTSLPPASSSSSLLTAPHSVSVESSGSSDWRSSITATNAGDKMTGLLSLLQIEPKTTLHSFAMAAAHSTPTSTRYDEKTTLLSRPASDSDSSPSSMTTPTRSRNPYPPTMPHTLARMNLAQLRGKRSSGLLTATKRSLSAANTPAKQQHHEVATLATSSSLLSSINANSLQKNIGNLLMSSEIQRFASYKDRGKGSLLSLLSEGRKTLRDSQDVMEILKQVGDVLNKYHRELVSRSKTSLNSSSSSLWSSDTSESLDASLYFSPKSSASSKTGSDQGTPLPGDQQLVSRLLDILEVLVTYSKAVREQILLQPPEFSIDSLSSSSPSLHQNRPSLNVSLEGVSSGGRSGAGGRGERMEVSEREVNTTSNLVEVSTRLTELRELSPDGERNVTEVAKWKSLNLSQARNSLTLSEDVWVEHDRNHTPLQMVTGDVQLPPPVKGSRCGLLLSTLLDFPNPPWKESSRNILSSVNILATLAEHCPVDSLHRFGQLLQRETLLICLEKEDPPLTCSLLRLLSHLVRSEDIVKVLCTHSDPCVLQLCYKCLLTPPTSSSSTSTTPPSSSIAPPTSSSSYIAPPPTSTTTPSSSVTPPTSFPMTPPTSSSHFVGKDNTQLLILQLISRISLSPVGPLALYEKCSCSHQLLSSLVSLLEKMLEGTYRLSHWHADQLCLLHEAVSLVFRISASDQYFDTHRDQCEHTYTHVFSRLAVLTKSPEFEGVAGMVNELLSYCEEFDESRDSG